MEKPDDPQVRLPEINQEKLFPYATAGSFLEAPNTMLDLQDMFSNTLRFEALRMKEAIKCISRQRG